MALATCEVRRSFTSGQTGSVDGSPSGAGAESGFIMAKPPPGSAFTRPAKRRSVPTGSVRCSQSSRPLT